jgi:hypothetical protein
MLPSGILKGACLASQWENRERNNPPFARVRNI